MSGYNFLYQTINSFSVDLSKCLQLMSHPQRIDLRANLCLSQKFRPEIQGDVLVNRFLCQVQNHLVRTSRQYARYRCRLPWLRSLLHKLCMLFPILFFHFQKYCLQDMDKVVHIPNQLNLHLLYHHERSQYFDLQKYF